MPRVVISDENNGRRLDRVLADEISDISRSRLKALIEDGHVTVNGKGATDPSGKVRAGQVYEIAVPPPVSATPEAEDIPLDVVYEDKDLLVINKPPGLVVHPAAGNHDGTLVNALLAHCGATLSGIGGVKRPGIVHRLDKDTSGLMVVAKNDAAHQGLSAQLADRTLSRAYLALVWGTPSPRKGKIQTHIGRSKTNRKKMAVLGSGGKEAVTHYEVRENFGTLASLVECRLHTGRTHQIRVHMAHIRNWLVGDPVYGPPSVSRILKPEKNRKPEALQMLKAFPRQALHAFELKFVHPASQKTMAFNCPLPEDMQELIGVLREG